jgi:uncharacterized protein RhaS with RHS repeats
MLRSRRFWRRVGPSTQRDPIGLAGGVNQYGYAGGDPVNYSDPFGLCPYEGATRTTDVESCPNDARKAAFRLLAADRGPEGRETIHVFATHAMSLTLNSGPVTCAGIQTSECTRGTSATIDGTRGAALVATDAVHSASHVSTPPGMLDGREEIRAWDRALNFYDRLPVVSKTGADENVASKMRTSNRAGYEAHLCQGKSC